VVEEEEDEKKSNGCEEEKTYSGGLQSGRREKKEKGGKRKKSISRLPFSQEGKKKLKNVLEKNKSQQPEKNYLISTKRQTVLIPVLTASYSVT